MDRAYSVLQIKSIDAEQRIIEGIASTPTPDRVGDVMDPGGAKFALPMPLLWQHQHDRPIGHVLSARVTAAGISIRAQLAKGVLPYVDEAWTLIKSGLVRGLSVGWKPLEAPERSGASMRFKKWEWVETSAVTIPMNAETTILAVKTADTAVRAALSRSPGRADAGVPAARSGRAMTISEQITAEKTTLQTDTQRLEELERAEDAGTLTDEERGELATITKAVDDRVVRIKRLETRESAESLFASPIGVPANGRTVPPARAPRVEVMKKELPKGWRFARYVMSMARAHGSTADALMDAKRWDDTPEVAAYIKAIAGTAVVGSPAWGGELADPQTLASEFIELLMPKTVIGRIAGFRMIPFNVRMIEETVESTVNWVGELAVKPVGESGYDEVFMTNSKIAGIIVLSDELVRLSTPSAQDTVTRNLTRKIQKFMDQQFLNPAVSATANNPASITNGVTPIAASGTTAAAFRTDHTDALQVFTGADLDLSTLVIVMHGSRAAGLSSLVTTLGVKEFPNMTVMGGSIDGIPVVVSNATQTDDIVYLVADEIFLADDGRVTVDASREATLDMAGGSSPVYSLWQRNAVGVKAERWIRWQKRRTNAVTFINNAAYSA